MKPRYKGDNFIRRWLGKRKEVRRERDRLLVVHAVAEARYDVVHELLSCISLADLEAVVERGKQNQNTVGHTDYMNLACYYFERVNAHKKTIADFEAEIAVLKDKNGQLTLALNEKETHQTA